MKKQNIIFGLILLCIISFCATGCSKKSKQKNYTIQGIISGADSSLLYLQCRALDSTSTIDSVKLGTDGKFTFKEKSLGYPEFYMLRLNNQIINLSVDSTETIGVKGSKANFATDYEITGSPSSVLLKNVIEAQTKLSQQVTSLQNDLKNKKITELQFEQGVQKSVNEYKSFARDIIFKNYRSTAAYFALFQRIEGNLIFNPNNKQDLQAYQTVATIWSQYMPNSPRTKQLTDFTLLALAERKKEENQVQLMNKIQTTKPSHTVDYLDINLPNLNNKNIDLHSLKGKLIVLDFTVYASDFSPAHNVWINNAYNKYKQAVNIYQVGFDTDSYSWSNVAVNLPWTCVREQLGLGSPLIAKYNIGALPATFIFDRKGNIIRRVDPREDLSQVLRKLL